jgi:hypothetical protein
MLRSEMISDIKKTNHCRTKQTFDGDYAQEFIALANAHRKI